MKNLPDLSTEDESSAVPTDYAGVRNLQDVTLVTSEGADHAAPRIDEPYLGF